MPAREITLDANAMLAITDAIKPNAFGSAAAFRNAILGDGILMMNPALDVQACPKGWAEKMRETYLVDVVASGRMVDFGYLPNDVVRAEAARAEEPMKAGDLVHPYSEWLAISRWEEGANCYFINGSTGGFSVVEFYGFVQPNGDPTLFLTDLALVRPDGGAILAPLTIPQSLEADQARVSNLVEPVATMLYLLANSSVRVGRWNPPTKQNLARIKAGRPSLPSHTVVEAGDYVTALRAHQASDVQAGGHHASPVAHWRRGHRRLLASGRVVPVAASHVNWRDGAEVHRLFYRGPSCFDAVKTPAMRP